jgi:hypothetical protein
LRLRRFRRAAIYCSAIDTGAEAVVGPEAFTAKMSLRSTLSGIFAEESLKPIWIAGIVKKNGIFAFAPVIA